jgi:superfamily II DNA/RNA helicase
MHYKSTSRGRSRFPSSKGGFLHNRFNGPQRKRGPAAENIDPARFINKVIAPETREEYTPQYSFDDFPVHPKLKEQIAAKGYVVPTPIQDQTIPHILEGLDVVGMANTGTGKTAAFLIPLIHRVVENDEEKVLIVVPTRELAIQIETELRSLTRGSGLNSVTLVGGAAFGPQLSRLRYNNQFIIGTPGRLKDMIERGTVDLAEFTTLVLDEADRMLDMGFIHDLRFIVSGMPQNRQTLFFSATASKTIEKLIGEFLRSPVRVSVKTGDTSQNVEQDVVRVGKGGDKFEVLRSLLSQEDFRKVLVFGRTKHGVERLAKALTRDGFASESIHGNKTQSGRHRALDLFKKDRVRVLVATDVAARGLDIDGVSHVINYDLPVSYDDYVHRIGRTGRAGKRGKALTFIE